MVRRVLETFKGRQISASASDKSLCTLVVPGSTHAHYCTGAIGKPALYIHITKFDLASNNLNDYTSFHHSPTLTTTSAFPMLFTCLKASTKPPSKTSAEPWRSHTWGPKPWWPKPWWPKPRRASWRNTTLRRASLRGAWVGQDFDAIFIRHLQQLIRLSATDAEGLAPRAVCAAACYAQPRDVRHGGSGWWLLVGFREGVAEDAYDLVDEEVVVGARSMWM